jgi:hypothetical protein
MKKSRVKLGKWNNLSTIEKVELTVNQHKVENYFLAEAVVMLQTASQHRSSKRETYSKLKIKTSSVQKKLLIHLKKIKLFSKISTFLSSIST